MMMTVITDVMEGAANPVVSLAIPLVAEAGMADSGPGSALRQDFVFFGFFCPILALIYGHEETGNIAIANRVTAS